MVDRPKRAAATRAQEKQAGQPGKKRSKEVEQRPAKTQKQEKGQSATGSDGDKERKVETKGKKGNGSSTAGSGASKRIQILLQNDVYALAYPPIESGHGEVDMPDDAPIKPKPEMPDNSKTSKDSTQRDYTSSDLTPFEQLLCAMLLSKPISHRLGLRTIATILSSPYAMRTPAALLDEAGFEGRRAAMWQARTQHKEKTAAQLGEAVQDLRRMCGAHGEKQTSKDEDVVALKPVLDACRHETSVAQAAEAVRKLLAPNVKGLGPTGVDIFLRRIQGEEVWSSVLFPFMDERTVGVARTLGLLDDGTKDALSAAKTLASSMPAGKDTPRDFVRLVDTLIGIDLEKQTEQILKKLGS